MSETNPPPQHAPEFLFRVEVAFHVTGRGVGLGTEYLLPPGLKRGDLLEIRRADGERLVTRLDSFTYGRRSSPDDLPFILFAALEPGQVSPGDEVWRIHQGGRE